MIVPKISPWEFNPFLLGNPAEYLDARDSLLAGTGLPASSSEPIQTWTARSGGNSTQTTLAARPILGQRASNLKFLAFDGVDDFMTIPNSAALQSTELTIYVAFRCDGRSQAGAFANILNKSAIDSTGWWLGVSNLTSNAHIRIDSGPASGFNQSMALVGAMDGQWHVLALRISQTQGRIWAQYDNQPFTTRAYANNNGATGFSNNSQITLGKGGTGSLSFARVEIAGIEIQPVWHDHEQVKLNIDYLYRNLIARNLVMAGEIGNGNFETLGSGGQTFALWTPRSANTVVTAVPGETGAYAARIESNVASQSIGLNGFPIGVFGRPAILTLRTRSSHPGMSLNVNDSILTPVTTSYATYSFTVPNSHAFYLKMNAVAQQDRYLEFDDVRLDPLT